ncbi:MAG TPA: hypothetical protein VHA33_14100 [Candidatus Angelobacter sp.]|jgi:hypothetical protein|nr:hypothetical protein [Candidatus Angelobacter sp.]
MPTNPFPESLEKDALRRRDAANLRVFRAQRGKGLTYCGLTSAEFLDVQIWRSLLASVCAIENDESTRNDLHINWRRLKLGLPFNVIAGNIFEYLQSSDAPCYDLYNLDLYRGFAYSAKANSSPCRDAIRALAEKQRQDKGSFALISTFNVRDSGVEQYDSLLDEIRGCLKGLVGVDTNLKEHGRSHATKIKLCYTFACWHVARTHDFQIEFADPVLYNSGKTNLVHFYCEFKHRSQALPTPYADRDNLRNISALPLRKMTGRISRVEMRPTQIVEPG